MAPINTTIKRIPRVPEKPWPFIKYVLRHCSTRMKLWMVVVYIGQAVGVACDVSIAWVLGRVVDAVMHNTTDPWPAVWHQLGIFAAIWIGRTIAFRTAEWGDLKYRSELMNTARNLLFARLVQQSQGFLHSNFAGVLANHVRRGGEVLGSIADRMQGNIIPLLVRFITAGVFLAGITPLLGGLMLGFFFMMVAAGILTAPVWTRLSRAHAESSSGLTGAIVDGITNLSTVQQNTGWPEEQRRLGVAHENIFKTYSARLRFTMVFWGGFDTVMTFFFLSFMALVVYGWQQGDVTAGQLSMACGLVMNVFGALAGTLNLLSSKFDDVGILSDALHKIATPLDVTDVKGAPAIAVTRGDIEFRNVTFAYPKSPLTLFRDFSLRIPAGQKVGLVGVSGAGKTTLCQLLLRAYDVQQGGIYIDGQNIAQVTQDSLHEAIAVIPQEPMLFHRTLGENIRYARRNATDAEVHAAAQAAEAVEFITVQSQGYDTLVGERGVKLSGGQRQRIAIARAIVKNAPLLVFDEATSALDSETEKSIQVAMLRAMEGRTTLVVAHRLSTLTQMDRLVVMAHGQVIEDGTFDQLLKLDGVFARLWRLQAGGFIPEDVPDELV